MSTFIDALIGIGVALLALDLVVMRLVLRKRPDYRLAILGAVCLAAAVLLLLLLPGTAH
jgi:predicted branched-subunit amino acid permease